MTKKGASKKKGGKKRKKGRKKRNDNSKLLYLLAGAVLLLSAFIYFIDGLWLPLEQYMASKEKTTTSAKIKPVKKTIPGPEKPALPPPITTPRLVIIIDDIGYNNRYIDIININVPITLAIIPFTPYSHEAATRGNSAGAEIILHLPMEPKDYPNSNPGKGALLTAMSKAAILKQIRNDLEAVPNISGVNNHMGSKFTEYEEGMKIVLKEIKERGLFFVDSKTSFNSVAYSLAKEMNIKTAERSVFLDNVQTEEAIKAQLMEAVKIAKIKGEAIAIGHPYIPTINVLKKTAPDLEKEGIKLVFASSLTR